MWFPVPLLRLSCSPTVHVAQGAGDLEELERALLWVRWVLVVEEDVW